MHVASSLGRPLVASLVARPSPFFTLACTMKASRALPALPALLSRSLRKLGADLSAARRRRRLTMALVAERAMVSRTTLSRVERGDPGVSMGIYGTVLFVLGMADRIGDLADPRSDDVGMSLDEERLPKRVRLPGRAPRTPRT